MAVTPAMNASKRRLVYGLNVAVAIVLAAAVTGLAIWAAARFGGRVDLTRARLNSLSPRTVQLLRGLDQDITITGLYSTALKEIRPHAEKHQAHVSDLLDLYESAARGKVTTQMIDSSESPAKVTDLLARLAGKPAYKDEAAPHAEALAAFPELNARLVQLIQAEMAELERLGGTDQRLAEIRELATIERFLRGAMEGAQETESSVAQLKADEIPRYGRAVQAVEDYVTQTRSMLEEIQGWMTANGPNVPGISSDTKTFFEGAATRYAPVLADIEDLVERATDLEPVKLEELWDQLKRGQTILVETPDEALVLSQDEVWPWRTDRNAPPPPDGDPRDFAGEQAISSAILKLTQTDKTAVIFTRFGGQPLLQAPPPPPNNPMMRLPEAPYQVLRELLEKENFVTREWDIKTQTDPPVVADAARVIYVVFRPMPPEQANPMRPAQEPPISPSQKQRIFDAVKESGMAVFLTPWMPPRMPYLPTPEKYEFEDYLKTSWGIEVKYSHLGLPFTVNPQREGLMLVSRAGQRLLLTSQVFHFTDHPIGQPLQGMPSAFQAVAPLEILTGEQAPAGITVDPIVEVSPTDDVWASTNINRINEDLKSKQGTQRYDDDIPAPFPLAVAATSEEGQKLVVFASERFVADAVVNMAQLVQVGGALQLAKLYPGNTDLFINALHWLTGNADRIAVGPKRGDVPRLDKLKDDGTLTFTRWFLVAIWPGLALLVGAGVWLARRR
jgi:hypothetical protein